MVNYPPFRKPSLYITLPSDRMRGFSGVHPVYSMVTTDDFIIRTPDALLNGLATEKIIENCCPTIQDASELSHCDTTYVLASIKIASTGPFIEFHSNCQSCNVSLPCEVSIQSLISSITVEKWFDSLNLGEVTVRFQSPTYRNFTAFSIKDYQYTRQLYQISKLESSEMYSEIIARLMEEKKQLLLAYHGSSIKEIFIKSNGVLVSEPKFIYEWFSKCDVDQQQKISQYIEQAIMQSKIPETKIKCDECMRENIIPIELDFCSVFRHRLIPKTEPEIMEELNVMGEEIKRLTNDILKMIWYMRGSVSYSEAMNLTFHERMCISKIIEENIEITKKIGMPFV